MAATDQVNARFGRGTLFSAAADIKQGWMEALRRTSLALLHHSPVKIARRACLIGEAYFFLGFGVLRSWRKAEPATDRTVLDLEVRKVAS